MANRFGGEWTEIKMRVFTKYLHAYMQIMKNKTYWPLIYFDGFAGSGEIQTKKQTRDLIEGTARHVLRLNDPREFDLYYFVEKDLDNAAHLQRIINTEFPGKVDKSIVRGGEDCNTKLLDMAAFMQSEKGKKHKAIAFIDPYGMQVKWESIQALQGVGVDLWILVPTGVAVNRVLKKNYEKDSVLFESLGSFFGVDPQAIEQKFYYEDRQMSLFGDPEFRKIGNAAEVAAGLYRERLNTVFSHVSQPLCLKNSNNAVLFHFIAASNVKTAVKIANDIIKKEN